MEIILWIIGGIILAFGLLIGIGIWMFNKNVNKEDSDYIKRFIKEKGGSKEASLSICYNGENWVSVNSNKKLPLASTVKIIIAIEYARQASKGMIDPNSTVGLRELNQFYVPKTDGGAHDAWLDTLSRLEDFDFNNILLSEVAKGMIGFSSNANTEYLLSVLGVENVNNLLVELELHNHDDIYPIVSSIAIPTYLINNKKFTKKETIKAMKSMDMIQYRNLALDIHNNWLQHPLTERDKKQISNNINPSIERIWSDCLPSSTSENYISIMKKLNSKTYFSQEMHHFLDPAMEQLMENPTNQTWLKHAGQKGGSTAFILTNSMYATDKDGNKTEIAFFSNNLTPLEKEKLSRNLNGFQLKFLKDKDFRLNIKKELEEITSSSETC
ncbi:serine hydrolase [Aquibacillus rhizosphaerae]|uniref:Serine hydrolase n=1 Tax=Aquibacillus rhizosphaerae TaxID=3051431 RepID=A0ABT7L8D5_9BACI|nr:serine hydrolase [Aquibacillus sp. LR5S19]MDL4842123.1 serine hydrolase [Aquibacillus sp. LR5S19]